jgi:hypothetical protein
MTDAAFYCVADERYFLGAVGMINSLRLHGHDEPVYLLDLGLTERQRELLAPEIELVAPPADTPPWLAKTHAPLDHPAQTMVLIDADMIVTRPLTDLIAEAASGRVIVFANESERFFSEWGELLGLGPIERGTYACSGLIVAGGEAGSRVISLLDEHQRTVDIDRTFAAAHDDAYPFLYPEQDVLNAILASSALDSGTTEVRPYELAPMPPFDGLAAREGIRCAYGDGREPYVVHHFGAKPWLERTHDGVYSQLLRRVLAAGPVRVDERDLPLRLRHSRLASVERCRIDLGERLRWRLRERA